MPGQHMVSTADWRHIQLSCDMRGGGQIIRAGQRGGLLAQPRGQRRPPAPQHHGQPGILATAQTAKAVSHQPGDLIGHVANIFRGSSLFHTRIIGALAARRQPV